MLAWNMGGGHRKNRPFGAFQPRLLGSSPVSTGYDAAIGASSSGSLPLARSAIGVFLPGRANRPIPMFSCTNSATSSEKGRRSRTRIPRDLPPKGTTLMGRYRGRELSVEIVDAGGDPAERAVECEGRRYSSLSAAARAITGGAVNGWRFWQLAAAKAEENS